MRVREPFPLLGTVAAGIAADGLFQDVLLIGILAVVVIAIFGSIGLLVYQKRQSRA